MITSDVLAGGLLGGVKGVKPPLVILWDIEHSIAKSSFCDTLSSHSSCSSTRCFL